MREPSRFIGVVMCALGLLLASGDAQALVHPGGWHTVTDIERVRQKLAAGAEPWVSAKAALMASGPTTTYQPSPLAVVSRGPANNAGNGNLRSDASNAYTLMIKWVATNDPAYADAALRVLDGWSAVLTSITGSDARLAAGIYGNKFAQAAELAAYARPSWPNKARAQAMFRSVFYPVIQLGAAANWGTACMAGISSMGVFVDDRALFDQAVSAYRNGFPLPAPGGCAAVTQYIDSSGENAESGRDQPHPQGGIAHLVETAVTAWNQGVKDVFAYGSNRLEVGLEYTAQYNLGNNVPYHPFVDCDGKLKYPGGISAINRGHFSPIYEMAYNYFKLAGVSAVYTKQVRDSAMYAPEGTNEDHPGLGTLMFTLDPLTPVPTGDAGPVASDGGGAGGAIDGGDDASSGATPPASDGPSPVADAGSAVSPAASEAGAMPSVDEAGLPPVGSHPAASFDASSLVAAAPSPSSVQPAGCNCGVVPGPSLSKAALAAGLGMCGLVALRRRRRRSHRSRA